jgi:hypothetical protein
MAFLGYNETDNVQIVVVRINSSKYPYYGCLIKPSIMEHMMKLNRERGCTHLPMMFEHYLFTSDDILYRMMPELIDVISNFYNIADCDNKNDISFQLTGIHYHELPFIQIIKNEFINQNNELIIEDEYITRKSIPKFDLVMSELRSLPGGSDCIEAQERFYSNC